MNGNEHRCLSFSSEWTHRWWFVQALTTTSVNATVWQLQRKDWFSHCDVTRNKVLFWTPDFSVFAVAMLSFWARSDYIWTKGWSAKSPACSSHRLYRLNTQTNTSFHSTTLSHLDLQVWQKKIRVQPQFVEMSFLWRVSGLSLRGAWSFKKSSV